MAAAVVIPWPTSARGMANETVPSGLMTIAIEVRRGQGGVGEQVGEVEEVERGWTVGTAACASSTVSCAAATSVGAAIR